MLRRILRVCCVGKDLWSFCVENDSEACVLGRFVSGCHVGKHFEGL